MFLPLFIVLCGCLPMCVWAQSYLDNPIILDEHSGLAAGHISTVLEDREGFLWIGGGDGLQRYDGLTYVKYIHSPHDSLSLISNNISHLSYDRRAHKLWISTWSTAGGLSVLDLTSNKFKNYYHSNDDPRGIKSSGLLWSFEDKFGTRWIGSKEGLIKYVDETDSFQLYEHPVTEVDQLSGSRPHSYGLISYGLDIDNDSLLWLGTRSGVSSFNVVSGHFHEYKDLRYKAINGPIRKILHHVDGWVYIATWSDGLFRLNPATLEVTKCNLLEFSNQAGSDLNSVKSLWAKSDEVLWVTTNRGLIEYNTLTGLSVLVAHKESENLRAEHSIKSVDTKGRLLGWSGHEVKIYDPLRQQFTRYDRVADDERIQFLPRRIIEDTVNSKLLITAQMSEGLYVVDLNDNTWDVILPPKEYFSKNYTFAGWDMLKTQQGEILVLTSSEIFRYSESEALLVPWQLLPTDRDGRSYRRILEDQSGHIWVGTTSKGLYKIDRKLNEVKNYTTELLGEDKTSYGGIWDLKEDRNGNIWIRGEGYSVYVPALDTFYNFPFFNHSEKVVYHVESMGVDHDGNVMICAHKNDKGYVGITDADNPHKGVQVVLESPMDFAMDKPFYILLDNNNVNWLLGSNVEQLSYEGSARVVLPYSYHQLKDRSLITQLANDDIVIGYRNGIATFSPEHIVIDDVQLSPYVYSFSVFNQAVDIQRSEGEVDMVHLSPLENFFTIGLSALNTSLYGNADFLYKLDGVDPDWMDPEDRRYVSYTDLRGGDYTFMLKARKKGGEWSDQTYLMSITIGTPSYLSWWALLIYGILITGGLYYISRILLSKKVADQEAIRLRELDEFKTRFYSNITHEFRTPLTVISGMTEELENYPDREPQKKLNLIKRNSERLLTLVNQMLDLSKVKAGKVVSNIQQGDILLFLKYLTESHMSYAKLNNIGLQFYAEEDVLVMDYDEVRLDQVLSNLISNAIKFTNEYGSILVVAKRFIDSGTDALEIKIKDSGIGISAEELPFIFDRYHQADPIHGNQGSGIGLALVKELVSLMNGSVAVESTLDVGSIFRVILPITNLASVTPERERQQSEESHSISDLMPLHHQGEDEGLPILLIIEDNADVTYYLKTSLQDQYRIITAVDGRDGVDKALAALPDIVISDVMMPTMDGYEVCEILKNDIRSNHIPIILLTAKATHDAKLTGLTTGADAYLTKPFQKEELVIRMNNLLATRRRLQEKYSMTLIGAIIPEERQLSKEELFIQQLERIVIAHLDDDGFTIVHLSRELTLSRSQVHRKIKALTGMSTAIYIRHVRLQRAKEILQTTAVSVSEVAYQVGFRSPAYFSQVYKEVFGESPSATRR